MRKDPGAWEGRGCDQEEKKVIIHLVKFVNQIIHVALFHGFLILHTQREG